jgi:hypothetical protein
MLSFVPHPWARPLPAFFKEARNIMAMLAGLVIAALIAWLAALVREHTLNAQRWKGAGPVQASVADGMAAPLRPSEPDVTAAPQGLSERTADRVMASGGLAQARLEPMQARPAAQGEWLLASLEKRASKDPAAVASAPPPAAPAAAAARPQHTGTAARQSQHTGKARHKVRQARPAKLPRTVAPVWRLDDGPQLKRPRIRQAERPRTRPGSPAKPARSKGKARLR